MIYLVTNQDTSHLREVRDIVVCTPQEVIDKLKDLESIGYDSETSGFDAYTSTLYTIQLGNNDFQCVIDVTTVDINLFKEILETKELLGHNLKFDLKFLYHQRIIPNEVYDTFLGEKTVSLGLNLHKCSLAACVDRHCGVVLDKEERNNINGKLTEGFVRYAALDVKYLHEIKEKQLKQLKATNSVISIHLDCKFVKVLAYVEYCGIKLDVDQWTAKVNKAKAELEGHKTVLDNFITENGITQFIDTQLDLFSPKSSVTINWNSSHQVVKFLNFVGVDTKVIEDGVEKNTTEASHLAKFAKDYPILETYIKYKEVMKDVSTYGDNWLRQINPISKRIHSQFTQLMNTGRLSSGGKNKQTKEEYLNFQNIPADQETRSCFVAEEGNLLIGCDYSGQEQIVLVNKCLDPNLLQFYDLGLADMHSFIASKMYPELEGLDLEEIKKKHKEKRQAAKSAGFAINYGGQGITIADNLGIPLEEGNKIYDAYFQAFPGLKKYFEDVKKFGVENGYVLISPVTGKRSYIYGYEEFVEKSREYKKKEFWDLYKKHKGQNTPTAQRLKKEVSEWFKKKGNIERMSLNFPIQGESAEITKLACIYFWRDYLLPNNLLFKVKIINIVHDEILIEAPESIAEEAGNALEKAMVMAGNVFCKRVPLKADPCIEKFWKK